MGIITLIFVFTLIFGQFLNIPITEDGLAISLVILFLAFMAWIIKSLLTKNPDFFTIPLSEIVHVLILVFFLIIIVSLINSRNLSISLLEVQRFTYCVLIYFFIIYNIKEQKQLNNVLIVMLSAYFLLSVIGIIEAYTGRSVYDFLSRKSLFGAGVSKGVLKMSDIGRIHGAVGDPEFHSGQMISFFFISLYFLFISKSKALKTLAMLFMLLSILNIVGTAFKGALVALGISLFIYSMLLQSSWKWSVLACCLLLITLIGFLSSIAFPQLNLSRLFKVTGEYEKRIDLRKNNTIIALNMALDHPIIGAGPNGFVIRYNQYCRGFPEAKKEKVRTHNTYAQVLAEFGFIGFGIFLFILMITVKNLYYLIKITIKQRYLTLSIMAIICAHLTLMMGSNFLLAQNFWLLLAIAWVMDRIYAPTKTPHSALFAF